MNLTSKRSDEGNYFIQRECGEIVCMVPAGDFARPIANQIVLALNVDVGYILELLNSNALLNEAHMNLLSAAQAVDQSFDSQVWNIKSVDALKRAVEASKKVLS
jgi:hypothetical protein